MKALKPFKPLIFEKYIKILEIIWNKNPTTDLG